MLTTFCPPEVIIPSLCRKGEAFHIRAPVAFQYANAVICSSLSVFIHQFA
ncbi:hypothetical protein SAMN05421740_105125 [Parapedobacter koreensis]|uniref:Uncharacterized protein n=1 Tax=Parapedobacter koreensis TaxID=332977 RepID=A0A1H7Q276_9SPHI|nr:hypothetical protein SAMN05421740_105125 [Parapedobacter koreensis]